MSPGAEIVLFEVAGARFGADMTQVRRIGKTKDGESVGAPLGTPADGRRAIFFAVEGLKELCLPVDRVLGVVNASPDRLRRMPLAAASACIMGAWLDNNQPVLLVDLHSTYSSSEAHHA